MKIAYHSIFVLSSLLVSLEVGADGVLELRRDLAETSKATGSEYAGHRDRLVASVSTNVLWLAVDDSRLDWRERLVARIVLERIVRSDDVRALRSYDWRSDPEFNLDWNRYVTGFAYEIGDLCRRRFAEAGLWNYLIEINWKGIDELSSKRFSYRLAEAWPRYAANTIKAEPEGWYLDKVTCDFILHEPLSRGPVQLRWVYDYLIKDNHSDAVPVLVERFEKYMNSLHDLSIEIFPGARDMSIRHRFDQIVSIADRRHVEFLEAYIGERPALEPLREKLDEVRNRPAPETSPEPPFRLMPTPEFLKTRPFVTDYASPRHSNGNE